MVMQQKDNAIGRTQIQTIDDTREHWTPGGKIRC